MRLSTVRERFGAIRFDELINELTLEDEIERVAEVKEWLDDRASESDAYAAYLERWGDWENPWDSYREDAGSTGIDGGHASSKAAESTST